MFPGARVLSELLLKGLRKAVKISNVIVSYGKLVVSDSPVDLTLILIFLHVRNYGAIQVPKIPSAP